MTDDDPQTDGGTATEERRAPGGQFHPTDVANIIEDGVSRVTTRRVGAFVAMAYGHLTDLLFLGLWAGSVYLFTYSLDFVSYSRNLALITITIGTFVLMAGANLIDQFGEQAVNFRAYIHNSITFITSGIAFLLGFLSRQIVENYTFEPPLSPRRGVAPRAQHRRLVSVPAVGLGPAEAALAARSAAHQGGRVPQEPGGLRRVPGVDRGALRGPP